MSSPGTPLSSLLDGLASTAPAPGAGAAAAWTGAIAAALVEMVSAIECRREDASPQAAARRDRAGELRPLVLALADEDVAAYGAVLAARGDRARFREALAAAAEPPLEIARNGAELCELAVDAAANARGGVRGEALAAVALANAAVCAAVPLVELNLGGAPGDPRLGEARELRARAQSLWCSASASP